MPRPRKKPTRGRSSTPGSGSDGEGPADIAPRPPPPASRSSRRSKRQPYTRALALGTVVALAAATATGVLRNWIWILALEPIAIGVVIGEAAAVPSAVRHRRPPPWTYLYVFLIGAGAYPLVHVFFWLASEGFMPSQSLFAFLRSAPSATAAPLFRSVDLGRGIALATGGATSLKYWIWVIEGFLMASSAALAYLGASVRRLKT